MQLCGTVVDADGQPMGRACDSGRAGVGLRHLWLVRNMVHTGTTVETETTPAGKFSLSFSRMTGGFSPKEFRPRRRHGDYQLRFAKFPLTRLLSDWPLHLSLVKAQGVRLRLVNAATSIGCYQSGGRRTR